LNSTPYAALRMLAALLAASAALLLGTTVARAEDLAELINHEIIGPQLSLAEVKAYTVARVAPLPKFETPGEWLIYGDETRKKVFENVIFRGAAAQWRDAKVRVQWQGEVEVPEGAGYRIKKLRYEAIPDLWIPALMYLPEKLEGKVPVHFDVNGHDRELGKSTKDKQIRCINLAKRGIIAMNLEWVGMGQLNSEDFLHYLINSIDLCGSSGIAVHYLAMTHGLDILLAEEHADPERVSMAGLSGGGWQTIFLSSLDTRIKLANPVAGYSSFFTRVEVVADLGDSEQTPVDLAANVDYATLTMMLAPRAALLTFNRKDDCCFAASHALPPLLEATEPVYKIFGKEDFLRSHVNESLTPPEGEKRVHNFGKENREELYKIIGHVFYNGSSDWSSEEIACDDQMKTKDELSVELPPKNASFHSIAVDLAKDLPRSPQPPEDSAALAAWQVERRAMLKTLVHAADYTVVARSMGDQILGNTEATYWQLRLSDTWTVPAVMLTRGEPLGTAILVADEGRSSMAAQAEALLAVHQQVLLVDPFYLGESKINTHDFLYGLLVSSVGERPLGVQASQLAAIARWLETEQNTGPVKLVAIGPRTSLMALVATGMEPEAISATVVRGSFASLHEILDRKMNSQQGPELFTFGLLEQFDIPQLVQLAAPRKVTFVK
jgi:hypothetical protein